MVFACLWRVNPAGRKGGIPKSDIRSALGSVFGPLKRALEVSWRLDEASLVVHSVIFKDAVSMLHRAASDLEHLSFPRVWDVLFGAGSWWKRSYAHAFCSCWLFSVRLRTWRVLLAISLGHFLVFSLRSMVVMVWKCLWRVNLAHQTGRVSRSEIWSALGSVFEPWRTQRCADSEACLWWD